MGWRTPTGMLVLGGVMGIICAVSLGHIIACGGVEHQLIVDLHRAQLLACVDQAKDKPEARACFDRVDARWGLLDGGDQ